MCSSDLMVDQWLPPMLGPAHAGIRALYDALRAMCLDAGLAIYEAQIKALLTRPDATPFLSAITCPTALIVGRDDQWSPVGQHQEMEAAIPGARLFIIDKAGHMAPAEEPEAFNAALRAWLARADSVKSEPVPDVP